MARMGERRGAERVLVENLRERDHLGNLSADGKIVLKGILKAMGWGVDWIDLAQERDKWRSL